MSEKTFFPQFSVIRDEEELESSVGCCQAGAENFMLSPNQTDIWTGYEGRLRYEAQKAQIDLTRQQMSLQQKAQIDLMRRQMFLEQKVQAEARMKDVQIQYEAYSRMIGGVVYKNSAGELIYAITSPNGQHIISKRLLSIDGYAAKIYVTYAPYETAVLEISWKGEGRHRIAFSKAEQGVLPNSFLKKLKSRGILFLVSGRSEKKAAEALLAFSFSTADIIEIPFRWGWGRNSAGKWHFAKRGDLTLQEVLRYE